MLPIVRNSFIQMSKLTNLKGRIHYFSSHARQENLYAVYETTSRNFWRLLAECNQEEFSRSGTAGKCIEARELIIALPENFVEYEPNMLLKLFTEHFRQTYGVECLSALHHNKRKTNYRIHLIFSERKLLEEPVEKIASRNMFYDEAGKHVRTKKEILDETGKVREGCKIIPKGKIYERKLFSKKNVWFKDERFLSEVKRSYTDLMNLYVKDDQNRLQVFDRDGAYLPMKKIGKNNPKAEQIAADNEVRKRWNQAVDRALLSGVPEMQVIQVKHTEISVRAKQSFRKCGNNPQLFVTIILLAITVLELLIRKVLNLAYQSTGMIRPARATKEEVGIEEKPVEELQSIPKAPVKTPLADKFPRLSEIYGKLETQNTAIYHREQQLSGLQQELAGVKGMFRGKQRKDLQAQIDEVQKQIENMKKYLSGIVREYGYETVKGFLDEFAAAKSAYTAYQKSVAVWEKQYGTKAEPDSIRRRLEYHRQQTRNRENVGQYQRHSSDREGR